MSTDAERSRTLWGVGTSRTLRAHWALIELDLPYRIEPIRTRTPDMDQPRFTRINPRKKIPVLRDGTLTVAESAAIVTYLAERYSSDAHRLIPARVTARAHYHEWASFVCMELDATSLYVLRRHEHLPEIYGDAPTAIEGARAYLDRMLESAAQLVGDLDAYLLGRQFSGVDILLTTCLDWAITYGRALPEPFLAYRERVAARPSYSRALAANQSSPPPSTS